MNLLENKNHKRGEYTLKSKIGVEKFNCATLPTEKKLSLGNLVKTSLTFGNETRRFCQNLKSFVLCNEYPFIGIRCLMTMEQIEASWRLLRPLHWLPDTSHRPPPLQLKLSNNFCYGFWGVFLCVFIYFFYRHRALPGSEGVLLHVEQISHCTWKCTCTIYWFERSLERKVQLLWSSGNASPFPSQRWLCLSLDPFHALHKSVSSVEGPFHVVWEHFIYIFSDFRSFI